MLYKFENEWGSLECLGIFPKAENAQGIGAPAKQYRLRYGAKAEVRKARPVVMGFPRPAAGITERKVAPKIVCKKLDSEI